MIRSPLGTCSETAPRLRRHRGMERDEIADGQLQSWSEPLALAAAQLLGIIDRAELLRIDSLEVKQDGTGDDRPGDAAAADLIGSDHVVAPERAVEVEQAHSAMLRAGGAGRRRLGKSEEEGRLSRGP